MKAWSCSDDEYPEHGAVLVFAATKGAARSIGSEHLEIAVINTAARVLDVPIPDGSTDRIGTDRECRAAGWGHEDESPCESCGKYACSLDEFAVCDVCHGCAECGCDAEEHADEESA